MLKKYWPKRLDSDQWSVDSELEAELKDLHDFHVKQRHLRRAEKFLAAHPEFQRRRQLPIPSSFSWQSPPAALAVTAAGPSSSSLPAVAAAASSSSLAGGDDDDDDGDARSVPLLPVNTLTGDNVITREKNNDNNDDPFVKKTTTAMNDTSSFSSSSFLRHINPSIFSADEGQNVEERRQQRRLQYEEQEEARQARVAQWLIERDWTLDGEEEEEDDDDDDDDDDERGGEEEEDGDVDEEIAEAASALIERVLEREVKPQIAAAIADNIKRDRQWFSHLGVSRVKYDHLKRVFKKRVREIVRGRRERVKVSVKSEWLKREPQASAKDRRDGDEAGLHTPTTGEFAWRALSSVSGGRATKAFMLVRHLVEVCAAAVIALQRPATTRFIIALVSVVGSPRQGHWILLERLEKKGGGGKWGFFSSYGLDPVKTEHYHITFSRRLRISKLMRVTTHQLQDASTAVCMQYCLLQLWCRVTHGTDFFRHFSGFTTLADNQIAHEKDVVARPGQTVLIANDRRCLSLFNQIFGHV